jgi:ABC-type transport system involved in cytochrome bd biosynthesis fused ATPase/permease subunit
VKILSELRHSTVMTVTHRLATIANYDRVLVVGNGRILEDGNPAGFKIITTTLLNFQCTGGSTFFFSSVDMWPFWGHF